MFHRNLWLFVVPFVGCAESPQGDWVLNQDELVATSSSSIERRLRQVELSLQKKNSGSREHPFIYQTGAIEAGIYNDFAADTQIIIPVSLPFEMKVKQVKIYGQVAAGTTTILASIYKLENSSAFLIEEPVERPRFVPFAAFTKISTWTLTSAVQKGLTFDFKNSVILEAGKTYGLYLQISPSGGNFQMGATGGGKNILGGLSIDTQGWLIGDPSTFTFGAFPPRVTTENVGSGIYDPVVVFKTILGTQVAGEIL